MSFSEQQLLIQPKQWEDVCQTGELWESQKAFVGSQLDTNGSGWLSQSLPRCASRHFSSEGPWRGIRSKGRWKVETFSLHKGSHSNKMGREGEGLRNRRDGFLSIRQRRKIWPTCLNKGLGSLEVLESQQLIVAMCKFNNQDGSWENEISRLAIDLRAD